MCFSYSSQESHIFFKIALAACKSSCYSARKFSMLHGGEPIALAVKALKLVALIPTVVGVLVFASPTAKAYWYLHLLRYLSLFLDGKRYDSS